MLEDAETGAKANGGVFARKAPPRTSVTSGFSRASNASRCAMAAATHVP